MGAGDAAIVGHRLAVATALDPLKRVDSPSSDGLFTGGPMFRKFLAVGVLLSASVSTSSAQGAAPAAAKPAGAPMTHGMMGQAHHAAKFSQIGRAHV